MSVLFDTHCHLNFKAFKKTVPAVIETSQQKGVQYFVIPGTDVKTSLRAQSITQEYSNVYFAAGIHPHHVFDLHIRMNEDRGEDVNKLIDEELLQIEQLLSDKKCVAVGEIGLDRHMYVQTKYGNYAVTDAFIELQKTVLERQLSLVIRFNTACIIHNREASVDVLHVMKKAFQRSMERRIVFHCCEPSDDILYFAQEARSFIGVDGDITFSEEKKSFIQKVPLEMLVLETDSPYLLPEPLKSEKKYPNTPANLHLIAEAVAKIKALSVEDVVEVTTQNAIELFQLRV